MVNKKKVTLVAIISILLALVLSLGILVGVALTTSKGVTNILVRNMLAFDLNMQAPEWKGKSYEKVPYSDISENDYLDLYVPEANEKMPLLILVHGGGFVYNDSQSRQATLMFNYFRSIGYACASINYRLAQEAPYPAAVEDVKCAIRFLRANADKYGYDADKFAIWGESAGGYLATMAGFSGEIEYSGVKFIGEKEPVSSKVSAVIDFYGVLDFKLCESDFKDDGIPTWLLALVGSTNMEKEDSFLSQFVGKSIAKLTDVEREELSPTKRIEKGIANKDLKVYIGHGSVDITVSRGQSLRLKDVAEKYFGKDNVEYHEMKNLKHADDRFYTEEALSPVKEFLENVW